jgi:hypothetical protein
MRKRPLLRIGNSMAKNFMGDRENISLAKNQKAEHVSMGLPSVQLKYTCGSLPVMSRM